MPKRCRKLEVRSTVLVVVEGDTEFAFCLYLKSIGARGRGFQIHVENAHGGSPDKIVQRAQRLTKQATYDRVVIIFDHDCDLTIRGEKIIRSLHATVFRFSPCVEGFYLKLMGLPIGTTSESCKRTFHEHGLDEKAKCDRDAYKRLFPLEKFEQLSGDAQFAELWKLFTNRET
jgi:hypothetical protein